MQDIQGRLGPKGRLERGRETRGAALGAKTHWSRNRKRKDGGGLGSEKGISNMLPVWKKGTLYE